MPRIVLIHKNENGAEAMKLVLELPACLDDHTDMSEAELKEHFKRYADFFFTVLATKGPRSFKIENDLVDGDYRYKRSILNN